MREQPWEVVPGAESIFADAKGAPSAEPTPQDQTATPSPSTSSTTVATAAPAPAKKKVMLNMKRTKTALLQGLKSGISSHVTRAVLVRTSCVGACMSSGT